MAMNSDGVDELLDYSDEACVQSLGALELVPTNPASSTDSEDILQDIGAGGSSRVVKADVSTKNLRTIPMVVTRSRSNSANRSTRGNHSRDRN